MLSKQVSLNNKQYVDSILLHIFTQLSLCFTEVKEKIDYGMSLHSPVSVYLVYETVPYWKHVA